MFSYLARFLMCNLGEEIFIWKRLLHESLGMLQMIMTRNRLLDRCMIKGAADILTAPRNLSIHESWGQ